MIRRALAFEVSGLRRSYVVPLTALFALGGAVLGRSVAWFGSLMEASEIDTFFALETAGIDVAFPLVMLALVIAAAWVFGHDVTDGTIDVLLTAPLRRETLVISKLVVLLCWTLALAVLAVLSDAGLRAMLAVTAVDPGGALPLVPALAAVLAGFASLPLVGWVALRLRSVIAALGAGIGLTVTSFSLRGLKLGSMLPWNAPHELAVGAADFSHVVGPVVLFLLGVAALLLRMRRLDLT